MFFFALVWTCLHIALAIRLDIDISPLMRSDIKEQKKIDLRTMGFCVRTLYQQVHGLEPRFDDLAKVAQQYGLQSFVLVSDDDHTLYAVSDTLATQPRPFGPKLLTTKPGYPNGKSAQLASFFEQVNPRQVVLFLDADIDASSVDIAALKAAFDDPKIGAAWMPSSTDGLRVSAGDRAMVAVLQGSLQAPAIVHRIDPHVIFGAILAVRPEAIAQIGGWKSFIAHLGEDVALATSLRRHGWQVSVVGGVGRATRKGQSLTQSFLRLTRWLTTLRHERLGVFVAYPLLVCALPLLTALWLSAYAQHPNAWRYDLVGIGLALAARLKVAQAAARATRRENFGFLVALCDVLIAESLLFIAWSYAFFGGPIRWGGRHFVRKQRLRHAIGLLARYLRFWVSAG